MWQKIELYEGQKRKKMKRKFVTIKLEVGTLWDIIFSIDEGVYPRLYKRLRDIALNAETKGRKEK